MEKGGDCAVLPVGNPFCFVSGRVTSTLLAEAFGDIKYDVGSYCECPQCDFDGIVDDFKEGDQS